jgi:hypothetical protein
MTDTAQWISVGDLADGFAPESNILPPSYDLAGKSLALGYEDGTGWVLAIEREGEAQFVVLAGGARAPVRVTSLREGLYFVDYVTADQSVTVLVDVGSGAVLRIDATLPTEEEAGASLLARAATGLALTAVKTQFRAARVAGRDGGCGFPRTAELVGKRIRYRYSQTELYEHIYLNESFYTWQCLSGVEKGLADTDLCHYFKLRDELYLFIWQEKIVPTLGVVTVDLARRKTDGKIFGYAGFKPGNFANFAVGAVATFANYTPPPVLA